MQKCLKCGSKKVYSSPEKSFFRKGVEVLVLGGLQAAYPKVTVCVDCGYIERYITETKDLDYIRQNWQQ